MKPYGTSWISPRGFEGTIGFVSHSGIQRASYSIMHGMARALSQGANQPRPPALVTNVETLCGVRAVEVGSKGGKSCWHPCCSAHQR